MIENKDNETVVQEIPDEIIEMERLHLRIFKDYISVLYRPSHSYIRFYKNGSNAEEEIKKLVLMSRDEFKQLLSNCPALPTFNKTNVAEIKSGHLEEWYLGAWKSQTDKYLLELGVINPIEEPIWTSELRNEPIHF